MKQLHHPLDVRTFSLGANYDINKEFLTGEKGTYIDACNMRPTDMSGDNGALKKIKGEVLYYDRDTGLTPCAAEQGVVALATNHYCIGTIEVNDNIVEFWAYRPLSDEDSIDIPSKYPAIKINGAIVAQSENLPFRYDFPLQMDKNEACVGGEIYVTDNNSAPLFFNVGDMMTNAGLFDEEDCTDKYYSAFNPEENSINIKNTINAPRFNAIHTSNSLNGTVAVNSGNGLEVGTYAYAVRFLDETGNRTEISEFTPTIPVYRSVSSRTRIHPWCYTFGGDTGTVSTFGLSLLIRGNSTNGFTKCEVIRASWNSGGAIALNAPPSPEVVMIFDLEPDTIKDYLVLDRSMDNIEGVGEEEATLVTTAVNRAKAVRFFDNTLYFMNVGVAGKDVDSTIGDNTTEPQQVEAYPCMEHMFKAAHNDPYQFAYSKSYMNNERYAFGIVYRDANGSKTFTQQLKFDQGDGVQDYFEFPTRREALSQKSIDVSYTGASYACTNENNIGWTHDTYALTSTRKRSEFCYFIQYLEDGSKCANLLYGNNANNKATAWQQCETLSSTYFSSSVLCNRFRTRNVYGVLSPRFLGDSDLADSSKGHFWSPIQSAWLGSNEKTNNTPDYGNTGWDMFSPNYYSMGLAIDKINSPDWATSFSIVRSEPALRVQASGICFYDLTPSYKAKLGTYKTLDTVIFYSADLDINKGILSSLGTELENSANGEYELHLEAPVGFNTEIYDADKSFNEHRGFDMLTVAWMQRDQRLSGTSWYLPSDYSTEPIVDDDYRYVAFGRWRNATEGSVWNGTKIFPIISVSLKQGSGTLAGERGGHHWVIQVRRNTIYNTTNVLAEYFSSEQVKEFHEPLYMASIVKVGQEPESGQNSNFITTGHIQQLKSNVYLSKGSPFETKLVDERWEDCISDIVHNNDGDYTQGSLISGESNLYYKYRRFTYQTLDGSTSERPWVDATLFSNSLIESILTGISQNGYYDIETIEGGSEVKRIYGIYSHKWSGQYYYNQIPTLVFSDTWLLDRGINLNGYVSSSYIPVSGSTISVRYDNRIPIRIFGGDTFHSEAIFPIADLRYTNDGKPYGGKGGVNDFRLSAGMPYHKYRLNERNVIVNNTTGLNNIQDNNIVNHRKDGKPSMIRQWMLMYISSSRTPLQSQYMNQGAREDINQFYPLVHHRPRPHKWKHDKIGEQNNVSESYYEDLGQEDLWWDWGGFRFLSVVNFDYAAVNTFHGYVTKPQTFEEETEFCTRIIWSEKKPVNIQDSPNVRTFPALNFFDISDDTGEIKYAYDTEGSKGSNLYAITDGGVCMLLTNKKILHEVSGDQLGTIGSESLGVLKQMWLTKHTGMPDEMWRSAAESPLALYWANRDSVFKLFNDSVLDIGRQKYHAKLNPSLSTIEEGYDTILTATYNKFHNEYWLNLKCLNNPLADYLSGIVSENYIPTKPYIITDIENNGGRVFPTEDTGYKGHIGIYDGANLIINAIDPVYLNLGNFNTGYGLSKTNTFKLCASSDSSPITIIDPVQFNREYIIEPSTCKCFEGRLLKPTAEERELLNPNIAKIPKEILWEVGTTATPHESQKGKSCKVTGVLSSTNLDPINSALYPNDSQDYSINWSISNSSNQYNITASADGKSATCFPPEGVLVIFKVEIYTDVNAAPAYTIYSQHSGCKPNISIEGKTAPTLKPFGGG